MKTTLLVGGALAGAFLAGALFQGYTGLGEANAFNPPQSAVTAAPRQTLSYSQPVATAVVERPVVYQEAPRVQRRRSWEREVLIVAGSSGAGAAIGGVAGGGKGAAIGAVSGGIAGVVYDLATRNR